MTHYSNNPGMVRVDYFKASGKWYMTEAVDMSNYWDGSLFIHDAVRLALQHEGLWKPHFTMVILEPYHENAYPIMFVASDE